MVDLAELKIINEIKEKAQAVKRTIVLPESHDDRVLKAAEKLTKEGIAKVITLGNENKIRERANEIEVDISGVRIIDPERSEMASDFANIFFNLRKHKGVTIESARETIKKDLLRKVWQMPL